MSGSPHFATARSHHRPLRGRDRSIAEVIATAAQKRALEARRQALRDNKNARQATGALGSRVACHVRRRPMHRWDMHYIAMTIDIDRAQANEAKHPSIWKCKGKRRHGKDGFDWGPSAVGISPAGDALVCVHIQFGR